MAGRLCATYICCRFRHDRLWTQTRCRRKAVGGETMNVEKLVLVFSPITKLSIRTKSGNNVNEVLYLKSRKCLYEITRDHTNSYETNRMPEKYPIIIPTVSVSINQIHAASCRRLFLLSSCCVMLCYICLLPCVVLIYTCRYSDPCGSYEIIIRYIYMFYKCTVRSSIAISCFPFG